MRIVVAPAPFDPRLARRVMEQLFAELAPRGAPPCPADADDPHARISVDVRWPSHDLARVLVTVRTLRHDYDGVRDLDLTRYPPDERPLALAIAADELLHALVDRAPPEPPAARPIAPTASSSEGAPPAAVTDPTAAHGEIGARLGWQAFSSGVSLVGPDADAQIGLASHVALDLRAGLRAAAGAEAGIRGGPIANAWVGGVRLLIGASPFVAPYGVAASAGVDALWLNAASPSLGRAGTGVMQIGASWWLTLAQGLRLVGDAHAGVAVADARVGPRDDRVSVSGGVLALTAGVAAAF